MEIKFDAVFEKRRLRALLITEFIPYPAKMHGMTELCIKSIDRIFLSHL